MTEHVTNFAGDCVPTCPACSAVTKAAPSSNQNTEIASELLSAITAAANAGDALALGPQSVKNLHGLLSDLLRSVETQPAASNLRAKVEALDIHTGTDYSFELVRAFRDRVLDLIDECSSVETTALRLNETFTVPEFPLPCGCTYWTNALGQSGRRFCNQHHNMLRQKNPSECKHESARLTCSDCGIDFPRGKVSSPEEPSGPPLYRHDWETLPGPSYRCKRCKTTCLDAHDALLCAVRPVKSKPRLRDSDAAFNLGVLPTEQPEKATEQLLADRDRLREVNKIALDKAQEALEGRSVEMDTEEKRALYGNIDQLTRKP